MPPILLMTAGGVIVLKLQRTAKTLTLRNRSITAIALQGQLRTATGVIASDQRFGTFCMLRA